MVTRISVLVHCPNHAIIQRAIIQQPFYNVSLQIGNNIKSYLEFFNSKPEIKKSGKGVLVNTTSYLTYPSNPLDISTIPDSPQDMEVKMKSLDAIEAVLGHEMDLNSLKQNTTCKDLNQVSFQLCGHSLFPGRFTDFHSALCFKFCH